EGLPMRRLVAAAGRLPRWTWLIVVGLIGGGLVLAVGSSRSPVLVDRGFKDANLSDAKTEAEVVAILWPPGDFSTAKPDGYIGGPTSGPPPKGRSVEWTDD